MWPAGHATFDILDPALADAVVGSVRHALGSGMIINSPHELNRPGFAGGNSA